MVTKVKGSVWDASDNEFITSGSTQRTIESKLNENVSVKDFGAVGDGVTDDTAVIQAADAVGPLYLPQGTYLISSNITITNHATFEWGASHQYGVYVQAGSSDFYVINSLVIKNTTSGIKVADFGTGTNKSITGIV